MANIKSINAIEASFNVDDSTELSGIAINPVIESKTSASCSGQVSLAANELDLDESTRESLKKVMKLLGITEYGKPFFLPHLPEEVAKMLSANKKGEDQSPMIRVKLTPRYIGVSKSTYHNFRNPKSDHYKADFPDVVDIGGNSKGHIKEELDAWLESKKRVIHVDSKGVAK